MAKRAIITIIDSDQRRILNESGVQIVSDYGDSVLVRGEESDWRNLRDRKLEVDEMHERPLRVGRATFAMTDAIAAETKAPVNLRANRKNYYLVQLGGPPQAEWLNVIRATGARIHDAVAQDTLLVGMLPNTVSTLAAMSWVEEITPYRPSMKAPQFYREAPGQLNVETLAAAALPADADPAEIQQVEISLFPNESSEDIASIIRAGGGTILGQNETSVTARVPASELTKIAEEPGVQAILPHAFPEFSNDKATVVMGIPTSRVVQGSDLRGEGQIVAIADSGLDTGSLSSLHPDFQSRVLQIRSLPVSPLLRSLAAGPAGFDDGPADTGKGHGTHVAGSVLGNGAAAAAIGSSLVPVGAAPGAKLFFQAIEQEVTWQPGVFFNKRGLFGIPDNLETLFDEAYAAGARIHTNSWGSPARTQAGQNIAGQYTKQARDLDKFAFEHADMLILFAAGNDGRDANGDGFIDADSVGAPGPAKNCVTVGATQNPRPAGSQPPPALALAGNPEAMATFSSRGPADDGRIKPDIVAPGTNVLSVRSSVATDQLWGPLPPAHPLRTMYWWSGGTSMSTPLVAGTAALVREFLIKRRGHFAPGAKPSSALLKAILVNGARSIAGGAAGEIPAIPNSVCGFGRVNLEASLDSLVFDDEEAHAVGTGQMRLFDCVPQFLTEPLRITLVWTDAPSTVDQGSLTNRLYLQVVTPSGQILNGDLQPFPNVVNNVQRIVVDAPENGVYKVRVRGVSVTLHSPIVASPNRPKQNFALAANANALTFLS